MKKFFLFLFAVLIAAIFTSCAQPDAEGPASATWTITFNANDGSGTMTPQSIVSGSTAPISLNAFTLSGYAFAGWSTVLNGPVVYADGASYTMGNANVVLYAKWSLNPSYTITFAANEGSGFMSPQLIVSGESETLELCLYSRENKIFAGWATELNGSPVYSDGAEYLMGSANVTLYACWSDLPSTAVVFKANGGTGSMNWQSIPNGTSATLAPCTFTRDGYSFVGWSLAATGTVPYADGASFAMGASSVVLYARWLSSNAAPASAFTFTITDGKAAITAYTGSATSVEVPSLVWDAATSSYCPVISIKGTSSTAGGFVKKVNLVSVILPEYLETLGNYTFYGCSTLANVTLPSSLTLIGNTVFTACMSLESISLPSSLESIGNSAFSGCSALVSLSIPASVEFIGTSPFMSCGSLESITVAAENESYRSDAGVLFTKDGSCLIAYPALKPGTSYTVGGEVFAIAASAFQGSENLVEITIEAPVDYIDRAAFAFCPALETVILPSTLTYIGNTAFFSCYALSSVTSYATEPPVLDGSAVFDSNASGRLFTVPTASASAYRAATNWTEYAAAINVRASNMLFSPVPGNKAYFGDAMALSSDGSTLIVKDDNGGTGYASVVYVFVRAGELWMNTASFELSDAFGTYSDNDTWNQDSLAVSADGTKVLVGVPYQGCAFVYTTTDKVTWTQSARLDPEVPVTDSRFGVSVSLSGDGLVALVGSQRMYSGTVGSAYVYVSLGTWTNSVETALLTPGTYGDYTFGSRVSLSADGNLAAVGDWDDSGEVYAVLPGAGAGFYTIEGVVRLYAVTARNWQDATETSRVYNLNSNAGSFGKDVALSADGKTLLVGCATRAFVFTGEAADSFVQVAELTASDTANIKYFGSTVALSGDGSVALVGDHYNGITGSNYGAAYLYERAGIWATATETDKLIPGETTPVRDASFFARSLCLPLDGRFAIVSAWQADFDSSDAISSPGIVYTYSLVE